MIQRAWVLIYLKLVSQQLKTNIVPFIDKLNIDGSEVIGCNTIHY